MRRGAVVGLVLVGALLSGADESRAGSQGQLDSAFGRGGKVTTSFAQGDSRAFAVAAAAKGKLVVAGESDRGSASAFALARYRPNGALDKTFGVHGRVRTTFPSVNAAATAVAIDRNGRVVVAGPTGSPRSAKRRIALARYLPDGTLDRGFGHRGKVMTALEARTVGVFLGASLALQPGGKIVVAATSDPAASGPSRFAVARYNADGSPDSSFGSRGVTTAAFGSDAAVATSLARGPDGKLVVAGYTFDPTSFALQGFALACFKANGSPDTAFGSGGRVTTVVGSASAAAAVAVQPDGKIIAAGSSFADKSLQIRHFSLVRYDPSGAPDRAFGQNGVVTTTFSNDDGIAGIALGAHGTILAAGSTVSQRGGHFRFALARYERDGSLDPSFGGDGTLTTAFAAAGDDQAHAVVAGPHDKFVVAGEASGQAVNRSVFALARYRG